MSTPGRSTRRPSVVVGVDGSPSALAAVELAALEASRRRRPLHIVHAFHWPYLETPLGPSALYRPDGGLREEADRILAQATARARTVAPDTPVDAEVVIDEPARALRAAVDPQTLLVLGERGHGGFAGLLLGSVAVQLSAHAPGPVLVARDTADPAAPVLVGVDGAPANEPAVEFAFEEAALRGVTLTALYAWTHPVSVETGDPLALDGWREKYPDVGVHRMVVRENARVALLAAAHRAQLLVVGTRGRGGFAGLLLGSVSHAMLHHASCPVAVVPHPPGVTPLNGGPS